MCFKSEYEPGPHSLSEIEPQIDKLFRGDSFAEIMDDLESAAESGDKWARSQIDNILKYV